MSGKDKELSSTEEKNFGEEKRRNESNSLLDNNETTDKVVGYNTEGMMQDKGMEFSSGKDKNFEEEKRRNESNTLRDTSEESNTLQDTNEESFALLDINEESNTVLDTYEKKEKEEEVFYKLLKAAVDFMIKSEKIQMDDFNSDGIIAKALKIQKENFKRIGNKIIDIEKKEEFDASFTAYFVLNTSVARHRILDAFVKCPDLRGSVEKENLKVISLAGGPGTDLIGFLSVLPEFKPKLLKNIDACIVDKCHQWDYYFGLVKDRILEGDEGLYGNISTMFENFEINSKFVKADLWEDGDKPKYDSKLREADIVLLVRFLDLFPFQDAKYDRYSFLQTLFSRMKSGALLFFMDTTTSGYVDEEVSMIYRSKLEDFELSNKKRRFGSIYLSYTSKAYLAIYKKKEIA